MNNRLLLVNDVSGYGRVSSFAMTPILATYGFHPYLLPTGLVSNTLDYGKSVDIISDLIDSQDNPFVLVDPIMADSGELYDNMYPGAIECNRKLASKADVIIPNFTEATLMSGMYEGKETLLAEEYVELVHAMSQFGCKAVVVTSCRLDDGRCFNLLYRPEVSDEPEFLFYDEVPCSFIGTGDIFSAVLISEIMKGSDLADAVNRAGSFVAEVITANADNPDHFDIYLEGSLRSLL